MASFTLCQVCRLEHEPGQCSSDLGQEHSLRDVPGSEHCPLVKALDPTLKVKIREDLPKPGGRVILVGDTHGCDREFQALMNKIKPPVDRMIDFVIILGDIVKQRS